MVKAIFFDFFKTLALWPGPDPEEDIIREFKLDEINQEIKPEELYLKVERAIAATNMIWSDNTPQHEIYSESIMGTYRESVLTDLGLEVNDVNSAKLEKILQDAANRTKLHPDAIKIMEGLRDKGYIIGLITSTWPHPMKDFVYCHEFGKLFDIIVPSCNTGYVKPDKEIFNLALGKVIVEAEDAVMVGDSLKSDIQGAKNAGMQTVFYDPKEKYEVKPVEADYHIKDLKELLFIF